MNKPHMTCRICRSEALEEIEKELKEGKRFRDIALGFVDFFEIDPHLLEQSIGTHFKRHYIEPHELTEDEKDFLERIKNGTATQEEQARIIASKAFEKALLYPETLKISDFFRLEQLKLSKQKVERRIRLNY